MESKLNYSAIETYAKAYSTKLADQLYDNRSSISGEDILGLSIKQIGLFILQEIQNIWEKEAGKLQSPFFNYETEDVQSGLKKLMNTLSKNISVERVDFEPILDKAVHDTLLLVVSPYTYFKNKSSNADTLDSGSKRFVEVNAALYTEIVNKIDPGAETSVHDQLEQLFMNTNVTPDEPKEYLAKFAAHHPIEEADFYFTRIEVADDDDELEVSSDSDNTLNHNFVNSPYETVADQLKQNNSGAMSIKSMLSINQKFMFINDLFNDNQDDFNKVVDFLESCESKEAANSFINNNYLKHNIWNPNAPQVKEFLELINKKFS